MIVKNPRSKVLRNSVISAGILLVLIISGGVAYTYFYGPDGSQAATVAPQSAGEPNTAFKPSKPAANAVESAAIQTITSPVAPGANTSVTVKTNPTSSCKISVVYNGVASTDSGLAPKAANEYGTVSWTWTVANTVPIGTWPVNITCEYHTRSAFVRAELVVAKAVQ